MQNKRDSLRGCIEKRQNYSADSTEIQSPAAHGQGNHKNTLLTSAYCQTGQKNSDSEKQTEQNISRKSDRCCFQT